MKLENIFTYCLLYFGILCNVSLYAQSPPEKMVLVEGGYFTMGFPKKHMQNNTLLGGRGVIKNETKEEKRPEIMVEDFYIDQYEVTNTEYCFFLNVEGNQEEGGKHWIDISHPDCLVEDVNGFFQAKVGFEEHPVIEVTWYGANAYAKWMDKRLPTQAEWEYAARAKGQDIKFGATNSKVDLHKYSNFCDLNCEESWQDTDKDDGYKQTAPVGSFEPNELGLYDMYGNVMEWCNDLDDSWLSQQVEDTNTTRLLRGCSWNSDYAKCNVATKAISVSNKGRNNIGFRCVQTP